MQHTLSKILALTVLPGCSLFRPDAQTGTETQGAAQHPNIVFFLADDLGWSDLGCMGSDFYETPHLDSLASQSLLFRQAYASAPNSAPSRACLLTGLYPQRHGVFTVGSSERGDAALRKLTPVKNTEDVRSEFVTLAEALSQQGYVCGHVGKWHLGQDGEGTGPLDQGFHSNVGGGHAGAPYNYFYPYRGKRGHHDDLIPGGHPGEYLTDRLTDEGLRFIEAHRHESFFLYLSQHAVHTPLQAPEPLIKKYKAKSAGSIHANPVYAAMIENMDWNVGRVLDKLEELGLSENTLFIFFSDNGGSEPVTDNYPLRGGKGQAYEGGTRVPLIMSWPGHLPAGQTDALVGGLDFYPTLVHLAGGKPSVVLDGMDLSDVLGLNHHGRLANIDSIADQLANREMYWHFPAYLQAYSKNGPPFRTTPYSSIRAGKWKLIYFYEDQRAELYDLEEDLSETQDRSKEMPAVTKKLERKLFRWLKKTNAPLPIE